MNGQEDIPPMKPVHTDDVRESRAGDSNSERTRQWGGFALGVAYLLIGVAPGIFSGWQHVNYILAFGGLVIAIGSLIWIFWSRRHPRREQGSNRNGDREVTKVAYVWTVLSIVVVLGIIYVLTLPR